jgi:hypothetical protein
VVLVWYLAFIVLLVVYEIERFVYLRPSDQNYEPELRNPDTDSFSSIYILTSLAIKRVNKQQTAKYFTA